ncbi:MAG TPA: hypothetical protein VJB90_02990 [Candidatus Nanoarchaeia archaeon]|nr:hypothetical protein [Candidatus Nanoarchaeia archaeon]
MNISRISCIECKGRYCNNYADCPIYSKVRIMNKSLDALKKTEITGQSPAPFVGHYGYPHVNVGILAPPEKVKDPELYDAPRTWAKDNYGIPQIVAYRSSLVNSRFVSSVKDRSGKLLEISREVAMASRPADVEIHLQKAPLMRMSFDLETAPMGPSARLKSAEITSNPKVATTVEKTVTDTDWKAQDAVVYLHDKGFDENFIMRLFSVGTLGIGENRKLVPTRWSITATDDILGKNAIEQIKSFSNYLGYSAYFGGYLGNYYLLLFFPEPWSYELFENFVPSGRWVENVSGKYSTDYESVHGRKDYAESTAGGYYTVRLVAAEHLAGIKKQGSVLALRFITDEYAVPLGVWVTREATRKALANKPVEFSSKELMLQYAAMKIKKQFNFDISHLLANSVLLRELRTQSKLSGFL